MRFWAAVAALLLAGCSRDHLRPLVLSAIVEARQTHIGSKLAGRISEVLVNEGDTVEAGAVLVRFERFELEAERAQLMARLRQVEADAKRLARGYRSEEIAQAAAAAQREAALLEALRRGPRAEELAEARAQYEAARAEAANHQANYSRLEALSKTGDVAPQALDDARTRRDSSARRTEAARQRLALLEAGTRPEEIRAAEQRVRQAEEAAKLARSGFRQEEVAQAKARVEEARALLAQNEVRLRETELRAPARSSVEIVSVRPGDLVPAGRTVVTLLEASQIWVRAYLPEPDLGRVKPGQKARVSVDAIAGRSFDATVEYIANEAEFLPRNVQTRDDRARQVFPLRLRVPRHDGALKPGMTVEVAF